MSCTVRRAETSELVSSSRLESLEDVPEDPKVSLLVVQLASDTLAAGIASSFEFRIVSDSSLRASAAGAVGSRKSSKSSSLI